MLQQQVVVCGHFDFTANICTNTYAVLHLWHRNTQNMSEFFGFFMFPDTGGAVLANNNKKRSLWLFNNAKRFNKAALFFFASRNEKVSGGPTWDELSSSWGCKSLRVNGRNTITDSSQSHLCRFCWLEEPFHRLSGGFLKKLYYSYSVHANAWPLRSISDGLRGITALRSRQTCRRREKNTLSNLLALFPWNSSFNTSSFGPAHAVLILFAQCRRDAQYIYFPSN